MNIYRKSDKTLDFARKRLYNNSSLISETKTSSVGTAPLTENVAAAESDKRCP